MDSTATPNVKHLIAIFVMAIFLATMGGWDLIKLFWE